MNKRQYLIELESIISFYKFWLISKKASKMLDGGGYDNSFKKLFKFLKVVEDKLGECQSFWQRMSTFRRSEILKNFIPSFFK